MEVCKGEENYCRNLVENGEQLTLSALDGGQLLLHGLVRGFGEGFGGGTVTVVHQVGSHHPGRRRRATTQSQCDAAAQNSTSVSLK